MSREVVGSHSVTPYLLTSDPLLCVHLQPPLFHIAEGTQISPLPPLILYLSFHSCFSKLSPSFLFVWVWVTIAQIIISLLSSGTDWDEDAGDNYMETKTGLWLLMNPRWDCSFDLTSSQSSWVTSGSLGLKIIHNGCLTPVASYRQRQEARDLRCLIGLLPHEKGIVHSSQSLKGSDTRASVSLHIGEESMEKIHLLYIYSVNSEIVLITWCCCFW